ncbi:hypothetical protein ACVK1X_005095 [Pseudomonas sp. PvR086]|nr:hypothetical protein [Pseudomonas frederiksbergensis]
MNSTNAVSLTHRNVRLYDCCAAERSLALLGSCYSGYG